MVSPLGLCMAKAFMYDAEQQFQLQGKMHLFHVRRFDDTLTTILVKVAAEDFLNYTKRVLPID